MARREKVFSFFWVVLLMVAPAWGQRGKGSDLHQIIENDKIGFIDSNGKIVIHPTFDANRYIFDDFSEGLAEFKDMKALSKYPFSKEGYIDSSGRIMIKPQFDVAYAFSDGRAQVVIGDLAGFIDATGKQIIKLERYPAPRSFHEGLAAIFSNYEFWYIDVNGKTVIPKQSGYPKDFAEGLACVYLPVDGRLKAGYIDKTGKVIIAPQFDDAFDFSEGLALVKKSGKYGYIDNEGKFAIAPRYRSAYNFSDGRARVSTQDKWGFVDRKGTAIIPEEYDYSTGDFSEGLAPVCLNNSCGYMGVGGNWLIKPSFKFAYEFRNGLAKVDYRTYIDKTGKVIWQSAR